MFKIILLVAAIIGISVLGALCFLLRPASKLHTLAVAKTSKKQNILTLCVILITVLACTLPMGLSPVWNGKIPDHRNQYELTAEAFLNGQLHLDLEVDPKLLEMENPYDPDAREASDVDFHWDHAFYNGRYYMYFGVVPVILVFLPFRAITGISLTTYHATQLFTALFIIGVFLLFKKLAKHFFKEMPLSMYLLLSTAVSTLSTWYIIATPALYCTAISAALCCEIWSLYFFFKAVWDNNKDLKTFSYAALGSLFGALAFGCRPSIALANVIVIPMLIVFLSKRKFSIKLLGQLCLSALPYLVVAVLLMLYNYARFENPFEFGQAYQLTVADQSAYGNMLDRWSWSTIIESICAFAFNFSKEPISCGIFLQFPLLLYAVFSLENENVRSALKTAKLRGVMAGIYSAILLIILIDVLWSPYILERYFMDFAWLIGIAAFILIGVYYNVKSDKKRFCSFICYLSLLAVIVSVILVVYPYDYNFTDYYKDRILSLMK